MDGNQLALSQTLPLASGKLSLYFDLLNAYKVFIEDENASQTFDGVHVGLDVPQTPAWGGTHAGTASFNLLPSCLQYYISDENTAGFVNASSLGCANTFSLSAIQRIDVNVYLLGTTDDYNGAICTHAGGCPHDSFTSGAAPFFQLLFFDQNCVDCTLPLADTNISYHFTEDEEQISYACAASPCDSQPITFTIGEGFSVSHAGNPIRISTRIHFNESISSFYYQDANYSVQKTGFSTYKSNVVVFPK